MKKIAILGSTGSIGTQTIDVVEANPEKLQIVALAANSNDVLMEEQIKRFQPEVVALADEAAALRLKQRYQGKTEILSGQAGLEAVATVASADTVLAALVGYAGLKPTLEAIKCHKNIALANKETLVAAGELVIEAVEANDVTLTPVDSEHSAIFQCLQGNKHDEVERLLITASGGPFRNKTAEELEHVTIEQCLNHPNWSMGHKVTVDSATLANKGLEIMEAHWLFGIPYDRIVPIIHPQSIIHSMVEFCDGAVVGQLGVPDMKLPIQYALSYPERWHCSYETMDLVKIAQLTFMEPDKQKFPALQLALESGKAGGIMPCVFNAANEIAVAAFLASEIKFTGISHLIASVLEKTTNVKNPTLEVIAQADFETRKLAKELLAAKF